MKKMLTQFCITACFIVSCTCNVFAVEPYDSIRTVTYEPYYIDSSWIISNKVQDNSTTVFIDVESYNGEVARFVSSATGGTVKVYNINSWDQNKYAYQKFLSNVISENQTENIVPIRMSSDEAASALNLVSELIFIDCNDIDTIHEKILAWVSHLSENGTIMGNQWSWTNVALVVVNAAADLNLSLTTNGNYWFLTKL